MEYSSGFNPHQKMHFALPLGVGITSEAEYLDAQIADGQDTDAIKNELDRVSSSAFDIINVRELLPDAQKAMASVCFAGYEIDLMQKNELHVADYIAQDSIILSKKTKTGIREVDVKAVLTQLSQDKNILTILMKAGSSDSIKPELICEDLFAFNGLEYRRDSIRICRKELYGPGLVPLDKYQVVL